MKKRETSIFTEWVLNNRFSVGLINVLLTLVIILVFNKISFVLSPINTFVSAVLPPILVALVQYYLMNPLVDLLEKRFKVPRPVTILAIFALVTVFLVWVINSLIPVVQNQIDSLVKNWPTIWKNSTNTVDDLLHSPRFSGLRDSLQKQLTSLQQDFSNTLGSTVTNALSNLTSAVSVATAIFTTLATAPFLLFFMLKDGHKLRPFLVKFAPQRWEQATSSLLHEVNQAVASYVTGQVSVAICVGIMFFIGYTIIGEPYGAALAICAGFLNLIPYFGTFIGLIPALIIALVTSLPMVANVLIVFFVEQIIETRVISPLVVGNRLKMHPITTIVVMLGAGSVWGLWGVIGGIPIYAVMKILLMHAYQYYRKVSHLYDDSFDEEPEKGKEEND
ncbi:AI-2E family transporter [Lactobacillus nasalidis]|uniref:AI-2E family transporter n=1 Tax=Lactobacillus nasalidis TaxID=2797258 RepID=A0ABQ3W609_9LACO|nr:AI-2E family transporter [Lactobacillus nasalidis]GHV96897.1 AI-2E family transporter [Lactobacillus nasalidis]GHW00156.1 AI-2E family transporter [Lactobacillus nasalidis]GHW00534.1 AI-2E family transporter [Lactobacillus nasalidis]